LVVYIIIVNAGDGGVHVHAAGSGVTKLESVSSHLDRPRCG